MDVINGQPRPYRVGEELVMTKPESTGKPFDISKRDVWEAYLKVKSNQGAPGVDGQSLADFEEDLKGNLYKIWNRMSSGSYFPPPVRAVPIPKPDGRVRMLGVPTIADRIAPTRTVGAGRGSGDPGDGVGARTGCSIWTSGRSSTASTITC